MVRNKQVVIGSGRQRRVEVGGGQGGPSGLSDPCDLCRWSELSWCLEWSRGHVGQDYQPR